MATNDNDAHDDDGAPTADGESIPSSVQQAAQGDPNLAGMSQALENLVRARGRNLAGLRSSHDGDRDLFDALGYPDHVTYRDYRAWYERGGIAKTIIQKPPSKTWEERPEIVDDADVGDDDQTDFEADVEALFDASDETELARGLRHYLERVDELARIGDYAVLFLGLSDADTESDLADPVDETQIDGLDDLLYLTPLGEGDANISEWNDDVSSRRNGLPELYSLDLANGSRSQTVEVHHSRVIHVAEGILDDEVMGQPALQPVINRLFDLEKVLGSSAEAFWMVSNPGLALSVDPELQDVPTDKMDKQVDEYEHNLRRVLKMYGVDVEQLDAQDVNPEPVVDSIVKTVAGTLGWPQRVLVGSERGDLASSQDEAHFHGVIGSRMTKYAEPVILRATLDRFLQFGVLRDPQGGSYTVDWPDLFELTELEQADLKSTLADAVKTLAPMDEPDTLHSLEELREFSPIEVDTDAPAPTERDPDADIDETDPEVTEAFDAVAADTDDAILDALPDGGSDE